MNLRLAGIDHLSPTAAALMTECERRFWWRYARKLGRDERSEAMATGAGLAHALEFGLLEGIARYYDERPKTDVFTDPVEDQRLRWIAETTIREVYDGYVARYPAPDGLEREVTYLVALPGTDRVLQARVDAVHPGQYLVEDKLRSGSSMREQDVENERLQGDQLTAEIYAHWKATKGKELLPVRFRCTKKIDPRKLKPTKERPEITKDHIEKTLAAHFAGEVFYEWSVTRTVEQLEQFEREFAAQATRGDELLRTSKQLTLEQVLKPGGGGDDPRGRRNTKACHMFGRTCPALAHCQGLASERELLIQQGVVQPDAPAQQALEVQA